MAYVCVCVSMRIFFPSGEPLSVHMTFFFLFKSSSFAYSITDRQPQTSLAFSVHTCIPIESLALL